MPAPALDWSNNVPRSTQFDDIYYSQNAGLEESRYVFLEGNGLPDNWKNDQNCTIVETGFGTGLNFLATWQSWRLSLRPCPRLHFISIEKFPLRHSDLAQALTAFPELNELSKQLLGKYPAPLPGQHRLEFEDGAIILDLHYTDVEQALDTLRQEANLCVDHWYLDGFSSSTNPDMWGQSLFQKMGFLSGSDTRFATFTAAGDVRRGLESAGFAVSKRAGFGHKREMLSGIHANESQSDRSLFSCWHLAGPPPPGTAKSVIVLGAGLAGASVAKALAKRGWQVQVLDQGGIASEASGNLQGVLFTRLSHRESNLNNFSAHSYSFALRQYQDMFDRGLLSTGLDGKFCGALHLDKTFDANSELAQTLSSLPEIATHLTSKQAEEISGLKHCPQGIFFHGAGWLNPPALCTALLSLKNIAVEENLGQLDILRTDKRWLIINSNGQQIAETETLVIALGAGSHRLSGLSWLPLQPIRGQVTHLSTTEQLKKLRTVLCHTGYLAPARQGVHCIGATFDLGDTDSEPKQDAHIENIENLQSALDLTRADLALAQSDDDIEIEGKVGFRCASPDYLPMVGAVPDYAAFLQAFGYLRKNAKIHRGDRGRCLPGLYLTTAHGSRGLTSTPLAAEVIAASINEEVSPLQPQLLQALSPARFIVRDLIRNRV